MPLSRLIAATAAAAVAVLTPLAAIAPVEAAARTAQPPPPNQLDSVSCPRPSVCLAVGGRGENAHTLAERWNGKRWRVLATPTLTGPQGRSVLASVSCVSTSRCLAVGWKSRAAFGNQAGVAEEWNGVRWRLLRVRFRGVLSLDGISCARAVCVIVGERQPKLGGYESPLAMSLTGTRLRPLRLALPHNFGAFLAGVSCASESFCAAVGGYETNVGTTTLAETWNGTTWRLRATPHPARFDTLLDAVSCASPELCMAGGAPVAGLRRGMTLNLLWKDGKWRTLTADRKIAGPPAVPSGVSCPTVAHCVATLYGLNSIRSAALTWNGGRTLGVHLVRQPPLGALFSISCPRPSRCIAVGGDARGPGTHNGVFAELWNGHRWLLMP